MHIRCHTPYLRFGRGGGGVSVQTHQLGVGDPTLQYDRFVKTAATGYFYLRQPVARNGAPFARVA